MTSCLRGYLQAQTTHHLLCNAYDVTCLSASYCTVAVDCSFPIWHIRRNDAELAQITVRKVVAGRSPRDDGRRAGRPEGVHTLTGLAVVTLDSGTLVAATNHVIPIPGEACKCERDISIMSTLMSRGQKKTQHGSTHSGS